MGMAIITNWQARDLIAWQDLPEKARAEFDSIISDSYFSGMLFRFVDNWERVIIGRFYS